MRRWRKPQVLMIRTLIFLSALLLFAGVGGTVKASPKVNVKKVTSVNSLTGSKTIKLAKGKKATLKTTVSVTPNKTANKKATYESSNTKVATVTSKGVITGKKAGTAKIIVRPAKNKKLKAVVTVKVVKGRVTSVKLDKTSGTLTKGKTVKLKASVKTTSGGSKDVVWTTSNKKVATVSSKGTVKAVGTGTAVITAKAADGSGKKAAYKVKVKNAAGGSIAFANDTVSTIYTSCEVRIRLLCSSPQHGKISWESSDPEVLDFVTEPGQNDVEGDNVLIYANQAGTATIKAAVDGKSVSHKITVKDFTPQYTYEINFLNPPYADGQYNIVYIKTDNPSTDNFNLFFYDTATGQENEPMLVPAAFEYADMKSMGPMVPSFLYKTDGGYVGVFAFEISGKTEITVQEFALDANGNKMSDRPGDGMPVIANAVLGYIDIRDYNKEKEAWMQSVIDQVTTGSMSKKEKMQAITSYMLLHSIYYKLAADTGRYVNIAAEGGVPFWKLEEYEFDSFSSPALLTAFGEMIDYPLENLYDKYERGTAEWDAWHMVARSIEDGTNYQFCPPTDSNLIDTSKVAQIDLSSWNFYTCYR